MRHSVALLSWREDWIELIAAAGGMALLGVAFASRSVPGVILGAGLALLAVVRLVTEVIGRRKLRRLTRYVTRHGLIVVGEGDVAFVAQGYVERIVDEVFVWLVDGEYFREDQLAGVLDGCVLEVSADVVSLHPFGWWCLGQCPWPWLPWARGKWLACQVSAERRLPGLPHEVFHRVLAAVHGIMERQEAHAYIEDAAFDLKG